MEQRLSDIAYLSAIRRTEVLDPWPLNRLLAATGSAAALWRAPLQALRSSGLPTGLLRRFVARRRELDPAQELARLVRAGVTAVLHGEPHYPAGLAPLPDAPAILFCRGQAACWERPEALAVVGTRRLTPYGRRVTDRLVRPVAAAGTVIVSGLALGVDAIAHQATLTAGGRTIAVLGAGVDAPTVGPRANARLAEDIVAQGGLLVSEHPPGVSGQRRYFPQRNRLIAGLSQATLVIEAPARSGALLTARAALTYGRDVLAVPGPIDSPQSAGPNRLLTEGAAPITSVEDISTYLSLNRRG